MLEPTWSISKMTGVPGVTCTDTWLDVPRYQLDAVVEGYQVLPMGVGFKYFFDVMRPSFNEFDVSALTNSEFVSVHSQLPTTTIRAQVNKQIWVRY